MYKVIINPAAGKGSSLTMWSKIEGRLKGFKIDYSSVITTKRGEAVKLAAETASKGFDKLLVIGGDGTLNEVVNGIQGYPLTIATIPTGSGNDFAKMLGIRDVEDGIKTLIANKTKRIDLGKVNGKYFINNLGIGFDAAVAHNYQRSRYLKGNLGYLCSVLKMLWRFQCCKIELMAGEQRFCEKAMSVSIGNGQFHGGIFRLTPDAIIDDGYLDICIIRQLPKIRLLFDIPKAIKGTHKELPEAILFRGKEILLTSEKPLFAHLDGEVMPEPLSKMEIEVVPGAIEVLTLV